eukprot:COSAG06_NODE_20953_length_775_cov_1.242604_1_plen_218_part_00
MGEGVIEKLELVVHEVNGARPTEKPKAGLKDGQTFMGSAIRDTALPLGDKKSTERPEPGLNWWRIAESPNRFHVIYGEQSKNGVGKMDKGHLRTASWQFRYSQVLVSDGQETERFAQKIPGTFIIRSSCSQIDEKNEKKKQAMNLKKKDLIDLINHHGGPGADYTAKLNTKRSREELLSLATKVGVGTADLAMATDLTEGQVHSQVAEYDEKKRRRM